MNLGLFILRLVVGFMMAGHGSQKLFGWFGGHGLQGTAGYFEVLGFRPGRLFAALAAVTEFFSGLLVAFGFLGPIGPALMTSVMVVAIYSVHWKNGLFAATNGVEVPLLYAVSGMALALIGAGAYSVDAALGVASNWTVGTNIVALGFGIAGAIATLMLRQRKPARVSA